MTDTVLATVRMRDVLVVLREAVEADVAAVVGLIAADQAAATRDSVGNESDLAPYVHAFRAIDADPAHLLMVASSANEVIGTMQLSFLPGLARHGSLRSQIEAVRVRQDHRDQGLGAFMLDWAVAESKRRGCTLVQLSSEKSRTQAHRFYGRLGFVASHEGFKLRL